MKLLEGRVPLLEGELQVPALVPHSQLREIYSVASSDRDDLKFDHTAFGVILTCNMSL